MSAATIINRTWDFCSGHKQGREISQILVINRVRVLGSGPMPPSNFSWIPESGTGTGIGQINECLKLGSVSLTSNLLLSSLHPSQDG